jgi:predicted GNAT family acetyltransferase
MNAPTVVHNPAAQRFEAGQGANLAECAYVRQGDVLVLHHTEVPPAFQGLGLAALLVQAALDWARANGLRVRPTCSYVASYMKRHPETQDLLAPAGG